jgi:uncharacterized membrane protein YfcA
VIALPAELTPWLAASLLVVSFVASFITASAGIGGGVLMLATLASVLPAAAVIPVHGVVQIGSNAGRAFLLRAHVDRRVLAFYVAGAVLGVLVGGSVYAVLPPDTIRVVLGLFILYSVWGPKLGRTRLANRAFLLVGSVTSFLTMFVGGTGPFVACFLDPGRFGKEGTVATHAACMTMQHSLKVAMIAFIGFAFGPWVVPLAAIIAAGFLGTMAGRAVLLRLPEHAFRSAFRVVLTLLALRLLWSARGLLLA